MTRQTPKKDQTAKKTDDRWATARRRQTSTTEAGRQLEVLHDRKSDMATLGQMLARIRAERS